jgi:hypothetical protein
MTSVKVVSKEIVRKISSKRKKSEIKCRSIVVKTIGFWREY